MTEVTTDAAVPVAVDELLKDVITLAPFMEAAPLQMVVKELTNNKSMPEQARLLAFLSAVFVSMAISQKRIADAVDLLKAAKLNDQSKTELAKVI